VQHAQAHHRGKREQCQQGTTVKRIQYTGAADPVDTLATQAAALSGSVCCQ
jgi:hypothetical protein